MIRLIEYAAFGRAAARRRHFHTARLHFEKSLADMKTAAAK
jgi:hypothetical protein